VHCVYLGAESDWTVPPAGERGDARRWLAVDGERPVVTFLGGLGFDHRKGFDTVWAAWQRLQEAGEWPALLVVAGDGAALEHWRTIVAASRWPATVRFLGFTRHVPALLAATDLLVSPTRYEPFGLNVQEAICRGVPAIVSALSGVAERYPAAAAPWLLADPDDSVALASAMRRWSLERAAWRTTAAAFGDALRAYSWEDMARQMVHVVSEDVHAAVPTKLS
jgi:glycosyltransferase involved in cell wall biosynthesis